MAALLGDRARTQVWAGSVIDADVHAAVPSLDALFPHMEPEWAQWIRDRGWTGPSGVAHVYPPNAPSTVRPEWRPADRPAASELALLREHVLDAWGVDYAVVNCYFAVDSIRNPHAAAAVARAVNNWLIAEWLDKDPRLVASLVVPARDPLGAIEEIERVGGHPGFVQVLMPVRSDRLYGNRIWHPVYEAMVRHELVMGLHYGGTAEDAPSSSGVASWYVEQYGCEWQNFGAQVINLVAEGVFREFPEFRVSVLEGGFTWLPVWGWRMDKGWKGVRSEIPWVDRLPFELIREHMRFSTAPMDAGPPHQLARIVEWLGSEDILIFATDYPHNHDDELSVLLDAVPVSMRPKLMAESARDWYRL